MENGHLCAWLPALRRRRAAGREYRVVAHRPVVRVLMLVLLAAVVAGAVGLGFWLGTLQRDVDFTYLQALERRGAALEGRVRDLTRELADARLAQTVDAQAAQSLRGTIGELRSRMAGLREEVTFYKSLMAPSSIERGLQIAEFELASADAEREFRYRLLLTQAEERRSWVQGSVRLEVRGVATGSDGSTVDRSLPLADLAELEKYPLRFRFRYFQDFSGILTLPDGFRPQVVLVTAAPSGAEPMERSFDWLPTPG